MKKDHFLKKVTVAESGCWEHSGAPGSHGYPQYAGTVAHRASWTLFKSDIPKGVFVLHNCHNKLCCRPSHLRLGSHQDNMDDVSQIGHPRRKLTEDDVRAIRASDLPIRVMARSYGVSQRCMQRVVRMETYRFVK